MPKLKHTTFPSYLLFRNAASVNVSVVVVVVVAVVVVVVVVVVVELLKVTNISSIYALAFLG